MDLQQDIQIVRAWSWARRPAPAFAGIRFFLAHASVDSRRGAIVQLSPEPAAQPSPVAVLGRWRRRDGSRTPAARDPAQWLPVKGARRLGRGILPES
jgi:hypothetical protein